MLARARPQDVPHTRRAIRGLRASVRAAASRAAEEARAVALAQRLKNGANELEDGGHVVADTLGADAQRAKAQPQELRVAPPIRASAGGVIATIDLDHELHARRHEIDDEAPDRHLPAKPNPETTAPKLPPQYLLRVGERAAMLTGAKDDDG